MRNVENKKKTTKNWFDLIEGRCVLWSRCWISRFYFVSFSVWRNRVAYEDFLNGKQVERVGRRVESWRRLPSRAPGDYKAIGEIVWMGKREKERKRRTWKWIEFDVAVGQSVTRRPWAAHWNFLVSVCLFCWQNWTELRSDPVRQIKWRREKSPWKIKTPLP